MKRLIHTITILGSAIAFPLISAASANADTVNITGIGFECTVNRDENSAITHQVGIVQMVEYPGAIACNYGSWQSNSIARIFIDSIGKWRIASEFTGNRYTSIEGYPGQLFLRHDCTNDGGCER